MSVAPPATGQPVPARPALDERLAADVGPMTAHLRITATRLARLLRRQADTGLSPSQLSALTSVERHGPMTLGDLAGWERVSPPTITNVVGKLEERGLVQRVHDAADRRVTRVSVTSAGTALLAEVRQRKDVWLAGRLAALDADQRARLEAALDVLDALTARESE
ncbi:MAG TPA: MarR family transcriptional regulator [Acidimicrobiales bacterium]|nr:MarR family transcriptional regulator [Acidimicrobiales bacterium]